MRSLFIVGCVGLLCLAAALPLESQVIYLPVSHEAYEFLKRMEIRGLLPEYRDAVKPLSRKYIAQCLVKLEETSNRMTDVEFDEFEFLKEEFNYELTQVSPDAIPGEDRWHLISKSIDEGVVNVDVNFKLSYTRSQGDRVDLRGQGVRLYGYAFKNIGYYFNFTDYRESGNAINLDKTNTPEQGIVRTLPGPWTAPPWTSVIEYNTTDAQFTLQLGKVDLSIEKMGNVWGLGRNGQVALSNKPPSYPQFKLRVPLASWLDLTYIHAELKSNVVDSQRSYVDYSASLRPFFRSVDRQKYMAAHIIEFTPWKGVDISLGESIVYSDRNPQLMYLIPVMFFKSGEHYNRDVDNCQFFGNLDLNVLAGFNFYCSVFIDELNTDGLMDPASERNQIGFTAGIQTSGLLLPNTDLIVEYTRMNPWTYTHKYAAANFTSNGYPLGHWMGQNADDIYVDLSYRPTRYAKVGFFVERYRKGGLKDISYQYKLPSQPFMYGPVRAETSLGLYGRAEVMRDLFCDVKFRSFKLENEDKTMPSHGSKPEWTITFGYGLW